MSRRTPIGWSPRVLGARRPLSSQVERVDVGILMAMAGGMWTTLLEKGCVELAARLPSEHWGTGPRTRAGKARTTRPRPDFGPILARWSGIRVCAGSGMPCDVPASRARPICRAFRNHIVESSNAERAKPRVLPWSRDCSGREKRGPHSRSAHRRGGRMNFGKVAVLMGGRSAEREISLMSGNGVLKALRSKGVDAHAFDPAERDLYELRKDGFARCFIALHGRGGEDGTMQGALEVLRIPYTGSGVMGSAMAMDKWRTKMVWIANDLPTPRYRILEASEKWSAVARELGLPLIVKPANEGSTLGLTKVTKAAQLPAAYEVAAGKFRDIALAEQFIDGPEYTASIVGDAPLPLIRIEAPQGNYDYQNKYFTDDTKYHCPSGLPKKKEQALQDLALHAFKLVGCAGWGRVDLMLDRKGRPWLLEVNTSPGMTGHSLVPMAAKAVGISYEDLCLTI